MIKLYIIEYIAFVKMSCKRNKYAEILENDKEVFISIAFYVQCKCDNSEWVRELTWLSNDESTFW